MSDDELLNYEAEDLDDVLLDDKIDEDDLLLSDEDLDGDDNNAVQSSVPVNRVALPSPVPSPTPGPAVESTPERSPEGNETVSSTPEKADVVATVASTDDDLADSTCTPDTVTAKDSSTNEVSSSGPSQEGSIPDYSVDLKDVTSSSSTMTPNSKASTQEFKTPISTEASDVVSSVDDNTPRTADAETTEDDERQERINPKTSVEKHSDVPFVDPRKQPLLPGELAGVVPMYQPRPESTFTHQPHMNYPMRPNYGRPPFGGRPYDFHHPGMRPPRMYRPPMRPGMRPPPPFMQPGQLPPNMPYGPPVHVIPHVQPPRKVLINPNFKGGVEAATSQLLKDTQLLGTIARPLSDEELLRQQEEFITRNLIQVEKRRHETSPPPRKRSRSRSRSPDRRRRSRSRSPFRGRYTRGDRRPPWRRNQDNWGRRRRSAERDNKRDEHEDEDEETRAYREQIEKQKAMREKILRDKEKRRKEAIESEKKQKEQEEQKRRDEEASLKCTPIVVTGKKIISLKSIKSKASDDEEKKNSSKPDATEETKTTAVVKPLPAIRPVFDDIDEKLERELLEESTTPPPPVPPVVNNPNRRVIIRDGDAKRKTTEEPVHIFDRLERSKASLGNESKRKIQRIVVNNSN